MKLFQTLTIVQATTAHSADDVRIARKICSSLKMDNLNLIYLAPMGADHGLKDVTYIPVHKPSRRWWRILSSSFRAIWHLRGRSFDIFHFHDPELLLAGIWYSVNGKKVVFDVHENVYLTFKEKDSLWFKSIFQYLLNTLINHLPGNINFVLAEKSYLPYFQNASGLKVIVQNFPKLDELSPFYIKNRDFRTPHLLYVGSVTKARGILVILRAMEKLVAEGIDVKFDCIGPFSDNVNRTVEFIKLAGSLSERVSFHGKKSIEEAYEISKKSNLGLAVLMPLMNYLESYPTKVFEYMTVGLPYVYSNFPAYLVMLKDKGGLSVDPTSSDELAVLIKRLFADPESLKHLVDAGVINSKLFSWNTEYCKLKDLYEHFTKEI